MSESVDDAGFAGNPSVCSGADGMVLSVADCNALLADIVSASVTVSDWLGR